MLTTDMRSEDVTIATEDGIALRGRWWRTDSPRATLVIAHGFGEHGGAYGHVAEELVGSPGVDVLAVDFRGHGRSPGRRGVVRHYEVLIDDLRSMVVWASRQNRGVPVFVLGHSNGGQVALRLAIEGCRQLSGVIASNPAIRIGMEVPRHKIMLGRLLKTFAPWITLSSGSDSIVLTRDPEMALLFRNDPLRHNRINPPFYFGMVDGEKVLMERASALRIPLLMILGSHDTMIDPNRSREFFDRVASEEKSLIIYQGMLHEPLNELGRERVIADIGRWLLDRIEGREFRA